MIIVYRTRDQYVVEELGPMEDPSVRSPYVEAPTLGSGHAMANHLNGHPKEKPKACPHCPAKKKRR